MADTPTNPIAAMVEALKRIAAGCPVGETWCMECCRNVAKRGHFDDCKTGIAARALEAFRASSLAEDKALVELVARASMAGALEITLADLAASVYQPCPSELAIARFVLAAVQEHMASATPQPTGDTDR